MDETEKKIRQVLYRMVEKRAHDYPRKVFQAALRNVIDKQCELGRIEKEGVKRLQEFADMLIDEHCCDEGNDDEKV
jgi:hypothetical protein